ITIRLDLYEESLEVPDYPFLGKTVGYMLGDTQERLYGTWFLLSHKIKENKAVLRMSNDIGSDAQTIEFTYLPDGSFTYRATGGNEVKRAVRRKLYKVVPEMVFHRK
ncbi:MAG: hypothetical protein IJ729_01395, partial [Alloprevotella sp.]|nr:hypothetical protein [Alloprevotella sp.]